MKRVFLLLIAIALLLCGCSDTEELKLSTLTESDFTEELNGRLGDFDPIRGRFTVVFDLRDNIFYYIEETHKQLEVKLDGEWYKIPEVEPGYHAAAFQVLGGKSETYEQYFEQYDYLFRTGDYRLIIFGDKAPLYKDQENEYGSFKSCAEFHLTI